MALTDWTNKIQDKKIRLLFGTVAALAGVMAILYYRQMTKGEKERKELLDMERQIQPLELKKLAKEGYSLDS